MGVIDGTCLLIASRLVYGSAMRIFFTCLLSLALVCACDDGGGPARPDAGGGTDSGTTDAGDTDAGDVDGGGGGCEAAIVSVATGMSAPVLVTAPEGDDRLFVVNLTGTVALIAADGSTSTFLDLSGTVTVDGDHGLNGLAFHPDYATNGLFFVTWAPSSANLRVSSFTVSADPDVADPASEVTILDIPLAQPAHSGGHLAFGPDGYLYIGVGDGESSPSAAHAQDLTTLPGSILRIDVDGGAPYAVPADNPFVGMGGGVREEIYAYGFRLPYRFSFDGTDLFVGEVGDRMYEQVELVTAGGNYGWPIVEGDGHCHTPATGCDPSGTEPPLYEFEHAGGRCAMMGGFVYRGSDLPSCHQGRYFFADYCTGQVSSFVVEGGAATDVTDGPVASSMVVSWGRGGDGELYLLGMDGEVFRLSASP